MSAQTNSTYNKQMKESYIYSFKMTYFKKLLIAGFNNSGSIRNIVTSDRSGYGEIILSPADFRFIDSIVVIDNAKMVKDSSVSVGKVAEGAQGKRVFDYAISQFQSKWLESIAKERSRQYMKSSNE